MMERRDFLKAGVVASGSLGLGAVGCGAVLEGLAMVPVPSVAELQALDMDGFLKRLDTSLGFIQSTSSLDTVVSKDVQKNAKLDPRFEHADDLVRKTIRSMLLTSSFGDLPEPARAHPGMQARLWSSMQEMDEAVTGANTMLTSLTPTERADITRLMREDPTVGPRILGALDDEAVKAGVNDKRRDHLRQVGQHVTFRMRQSTSLLIDDYDAKVKKVTARDASVEAIQRRLMADMGEKAFWEYHGRQMAYMQAWQNVPGIAQSAPPSPTAPTAGLPPSPGSAGPPATATAVATATAAAAATWTAGAPSSTAAAAGAPPATATYPVYPIPPPSGAPPQVRIVGEDGEAVDDKGRNIHYYKKGGTLLTVGGILFGVGAIFGGIGALLLTTNTGTGGAGAVGAILLTNAAAIGLSAIGCLIAGGVYRAKA